MKVDAFITKHDENKTYEISYFHNPLRWSENIIKTSIPVLKEKNWSSPIKYLNNTGDDISDEIKKLPSNKGGVYMFIIKGNTLPFCELYLAYIGRAKCTKNQNLRKRAKEYLLETKRIDPRPKIERLFKYWKDFLYFRYYATTDNKMIDETENCLIRAILPPFNDEIPDKIDFKKPENAF